MAASISYKNTVLADNPLSYYRMDAASGTVETDLGSRAQNATINGTVSYSQTGAILGDTDKAMKPNGTTGYLSVPTTSLPTGSSSFSMECWVNFSSLPGAGVYPVVIANGSNATNQEVSIYCNGDGPNVMNAGINGGTDIPATSSISANKWYHIVVTYNGTTCTLYQNGVSQATQNLTFNITYGSLTIAQEFSAHFAGCTIDEVAFYSTALSSTRVLAHYNAGIAVTKSVGARTRLAIQATKTVNAARVRLAILATKTVNAARLRLAVTSTKTAGVRTRLISFINKNVGARTRLAVQATKSVGARARLILGTVTKSLGARTRLAILVSKTAGVRTKLAVLVSKTAGVRARLAILSTKWAGVRTRLAVQVAKVAGARLRLFVPVTTKSVGARIRIAVANIFASNVASTIGGLTQSDQMSQVTGGVETSVSVTMPATSLNTYVELLAQGGTSSGTSVLPAPTGKGWSISLAGSTILAGYWQSAFTLAKSGSTMTGAALYVRWFRRTMDGTYYPIGSTSLTSQSYSTTKSLYVLPSVVAALWEFVAGDTLYMDCFVYNGATSWASAAFTVYVSNSASAGVYNDGTITTPTIISTPAGIACYTGVPSFLSGTTLPIRDQSFTLADTVDQRSIVTLVGEDTTGTLAYQRAMPMILSDHDQGRLYTGFVNSDKVSKPAVGNSNAQLEHALTYMDNHYGADKRANTTNYLNWSAGDMVCDFISSTLSQEGITGAFAIDSDYSQAAFAQGTLSGTTATQTTTPFVYAPNTASPPITSNTGDLELVRAGTQFTLTESATSDFSSGTLTNMTASNNQLSPSTQNAIKVVAQFPVAMPSANRPATTSGGSQTLAEYIFNSATAKIWSGSMTIGTSDTLNYDVWIAGTSPDFLAGVDILCSDGTKLSTQNGTFDSNNATGLHDQNGISVDLLTDISGYAKDAWYTRTITLTGLNGKTINSVSIVMAGSTAGAYTVFVKNCYLGSQSGSPFFGTTATATQVNPPTITTLGGYVASTVITSVVAVYNPVTSYRVSPSHSISGVGLVQNSSINWTASLPASGASPATFPPGESGTTASSGGQLSAMVMLVSYDSSTWLECQNNQALPGLPPGANVSGLSLYLREQFAAGSDPSAIPALVQVNVTINSAANTTVSDVVASYGTSTQWNTGTFSNTALTSSGNLTLGAGNPLVRNWNDNLITNQTFLSGWNNAGTQAATGGTYTMTPGSNAGTWCQSRFDFAGSIQDGTIECDLKISATNGQCGIEYRQTGWGNANNNGAYYAYIEQGVGVEFGYGGNSYSTTDGTFQTLVQVSKTVNTNTTYHLKVVVKGNRHTIYFNNESTPSIDILDATYSGAGQMGFRCYNPTSSFTATIDNFTVTTINVGTWTSPSTSLSSLGTCGYNEISWTELTPAGNIQSTAIVEASLDGGTTWQACTNGALLPQLSRGTSVSGKSLLLQVILFTDSPITAPVIYGLNVRVCGPYGTVTGTRISPVLNLSPIGYIGSSNVMWNANIPTGTTLTVASTQDLSTYHTVGSNGAGEALPYWANQVAATQDLFSSNTLSNYTNTSKVGGSAAAATYDTTNSRITLTGGSNALYLNNAISCADIDMLVDMDRSDAGGIVWQELDLNAGDFYELGVYDDSSSGGFTNQLRLYKTSSGTRTLLGSASNITFTRGTFHRVRITQSGGLIDVYWDGTCVQSYLDLFPLGAGKCGLRNDGGTSRYYQLWVQPLGSNLSGQALWTKVTMTTTDPSVMPQLFTLVACVRGPSIATGATIAQLHPITKPFAAYYSTEIDTIAQASGPFFWYVTRWKEMIFRDRLARPGAFPIQSAADSAGVYSGSLLYVPQVSVLSSADLFRNDMIITNVSGLVTPPPEVKTSDGSTTSWTMGYPLYSAPTITINGQGATVGLQGVDSGHQFYWQPGSPSISYDSSLPKLPAGTILVFTYTGQSTVNVVQDNSSSQTVQAALEGNSGIVSAIQTALSNNVLGMTTAQATTFAQGLLSRYGSNNTIEMVGTTRYPGLVPGTTIPIFIPEIMSTWNSQVPIVKVTTTAYQGINGLIWLYSIDATNGPSLNNWTRMFYAQ